MTERLGVRDIYAPRGLELGSFINCAWPGLNKVQRVPRKDLQGLNRLLFRVGFGLYYDVKVGFVIRARDMYTNLPERAARGNIKRYFEEAKAEYERRSAEYELAKAGGGLNKLSVETVVEFMLEADAAYPELWRWSVDAPLKLWGDYVVTPSHGPLHSLLVAFWPVQFELGNHLRELNGLSAPGIYEIDAYGTPQWRSLTAHPHTWGQHIEFEDKLYGGMCAGNADFGHGMISTFSQLRHWHLGTTDHVADHGWLGSAEAFWRDHSESFFATVPYPKYIVCPENPTNERHIAEVKPLNHAIMLKLQPDRNVTVYCEHCSKALKYSALTGFDPRQSCVQGFCRIRNHGNGKKLCEECFVNHSAWDFHQGQIIKPLLKEWFFKSRAITYHRCQFGGNGSYGWWNGGHCEAQAHWRIKDEKRWTSERIGYTRPVWLCEYHKNTLPEKSYFEERILTSEGDAAYWWEEIEKNELGAPVGTYFCEAREIVDTNGTAMYCDLVGTRRNPHGGRFYVLCEEHFGMLPQPTAEAEERTEIEHAEPTDTAEMDREATGDTGLHLVLDHGAGGVEYFDGEAVELAGATTTMAATDLNDLLDLI